MKTQFAQDLRLARRKAGLTQGDVAYLLAVHPSTVSQLEQGHVSPSLHQIIDLSLVYGRSFESFFAELMTERRDHLTTRLGSLPNPGRETAATFNRESSLARMKERLDELPNHDIA